MLFCCRAGSRPWFNFGITDDTDGNARPRVASGLAFQVVRILMNHKRPSQEGMQVDSLELHVDIGHSAGVSRDVAQVSLMVVRGIRRTVLVGIRIVVSAR